MEIREIEKNDFYKGYLDLMYELTNYKLIQTINNFEKYINENKNKVKIIIVYDKNTDKIIGSGSIFKLEKLHNNPFGQIEDVIINDNYRGLGLGKKIVAELINIGLNVFNCYKVVLNCNESKVSFYEKCNFLNSGNQMKLYKE